MTIDARPRAPRRAAAARARPRARPDRVRQLHGVEPAESAARARARRTPTARSASRRARPIRPASRSASSHGRCSSPGDEVVDLLDARRARTRRAAPRSCSRASSGEGVQIFVATVTPRRGAVERGGERRLRAPVHRRRVEQPRAGPSAAPTTSPARPRRVEGVPGAEADDRAETALLHHECRSVPRQHAGRVRGREERAVLVRPAAHVPERQAGAGLAPARGRRPPSRDSSPSGASQPAATRRRRRRGRARARRACDATRRGGARGRRRPRRARRAIGPPSERGARRSPRRPRRARRARAGVPVPTIPGPTEQTTASKPWPRPRRARTRRSTRRTAAVEARRRRDRDRRRAPVGSARTRVGQRDRQRAAGSCTYAHPQRRPEPGAAPGAAGCAACSRRRAARRASRRARRPPRRAGRRPAPACTGASSRARPAPARARARA